MSLELKGLVENFGGYSLTNQIEFNTIGWIEHGLLFHGGFGIVNAGSGNFFSSDESMLRLGNDQNYLNGCVWNGFGKKWVWETGIAANPAPFRVSGVWVNGDFHPVNETGFYAHHIDYLNGRIIFDNPQDPQATIQASYCYNLVNFDHADSQDFREMMQRSLITFSEESPPTSEPDRSHQIWLPAVFVEIETGKQRGLELGGGQIKTREICFYIFADRVSDRNLLADWLDFQSRSSFTMGDMNKLTFPFDEFGSVVSGITNFEDLIITQPYKKLRIKDGIYKSLPNINPNIFRAKISWQAEIDVFGI